eukprot:SAG11_NODE_269_length_11407_cov_13.825964_7_plen_172_part_00
MTHSDRSGSTGPCALPPLRHFSPIHAARHRRCELRRVIVDRARPMLRRCGRRSKARSCAARWRRRGCVHCAVWMGRRLSVARLRGSCRQLVVWQTACQLARLLRLARHMPVVCALFVFALDGGTPLESVRCVGMCRGGGTGQGRNGRNVGGAGGGAARMARVGGGSMACAP